MLRTVAKNLIPQRVSRRTTTYKAPIREVNFVLNDVLKVWESGAMPEHCTPDTVEMVTAEIAKFAENTLHPLYQVGDEEGCKFDGTSVTSPPGWKEAYAQYVEGGWPTLFPPAEYGGQGFPHTFDSIKTEFCSTANWPWFMYIILGHGAVECLLDWGSEELKAKFLPPLVSGEYTGTMCLTEGGAGSDLNQVKTKAEPLANGEFKINGSKIFISSGDCDWAPNIVHLVLARLPDAPQGTKGISLFVVPKYVIKEDGTLEDKLNVTCGGIEHKMGIKGSATCTMNFEDATGYLVGQPHQGMKQMFSFMNSARLHVGYQGLGATELALQNAVPYAKERLAGRRPGGASHPDKPADPIIEHPDIRRMILKMKAFSEASRCLALHAALLVDRKTASTDKAEIEALDDEVGLLTPIVKAFLTDVGCEASCDGIQVYGGHGYIREWGMEQIYRDARIATIYEGTNSIQSFDLLGRKVMLNKGKSLHAFCAKIRKSCESHMNDARLASHALTLTQLSAEWMELSMQLMIKAAKDPAVLESAAVDYLQYSGYVTFAYFWIEMEAAALVQLDNGGDPAFYETKLQTAQFYFNRLLPRTKTFAATMVSSTTDLTAMPSANIILEE